MVWVSDNAALVIMSFDNIGITVISRIKHFIKFAKKNILNEMIFRNIKEQDLRIKTSSRQVILP